MPNSKNSIDEAILDLYRSGRTRNEIARILGKSHNRVQNVIREAGSYTRATHSITQRARAKRFRAINRSRHIPIPFLRLTSIDASIYARRGNLISSEKRRLIQDLIGDISP